MIDGANPETMSTETQQEKMYNSRQVADVVNRERQAAIEKGKREAQAQYERELAEIRAAQAGGGMGGMKPDVDPDKLKSEIYGQVMQEMQAKQQQMIEQQRQAELHQIAGEYLSKTAKGKELFSDFEQMTADINGEAFPNIIIMSSKLDNAAEVVYELGQNPMKLEAIESLALRSPKMAEQQLRKMSESIKQNQAALANNKRTNPPISSVRPSTNTQAGSDSQRLSVSDMRKLPFLRK